jgi:(R,R)-butanediol dehydrogenase/meso-butanediol dehydrogenase/diacetyl reductase
VKQVRIHGPGDVRIDEVDPIEPGPRDAVISVAACGICGSDVGYVRLGGVAGPTRAPLPIGHELSGVVARVGSEVRDLAPGTRVVLNPMAAGNSIGNGGAQGGFAPELLVPNAADGGVLLPIPDSLSFEAAALAEPLGVGMQAVNRSGAVRGEKVVVFGAGPIGLMSLATLRHRGIDDVLVVDRSARRLEVAARLGARATLDATTEDVWARIRELHGAGSWLGMEMPGSDAYIEASGASSVLLDIIGRARENARVSIVALHRDPIEVSFLTVMSKQLTLAGSICYPEDFGEMIEMLQKVDLTPVITHRFPLDRFVEAFEVASDTDAGAKIMIEVESNAHR